MEIKIPELLRVEIAVHQFLPLGALGKGIELGGGGRASDQIHRQLHQLQAALFVAIASRFDGGRAGEQEVGVPHQRAAQRGPGRLMQRATRRFEMLHRAAALQLHLRSVDLFPCVV